MKRLLLLVTALLLCTLAAACEHIDDESGAPETTKSLSIPGTLPSETEQVEVPFASIGRILYASAMFFMTADGKIERLKAKKN